MLAGRPLKSGRSAKERKRGSKNIEIAKRLFIAHNALPLLEATGIAAGTARGRASGTASREHLAPHVASQLAPQPARQSGTK